MLIRRAEANEYLSIKEFYANLIDEMKDAKYTPGWQKGIYPADSYLKDLIDGGQIYIGIENGEIVAAMALNHDSNESYKQAKWQIQAEIQEALVIHILGVRPKNSCKGIGKKMVAAAQQFATENNLKVIRLDVLKGNLPAEKLYEKMGFLYVETLSMFYEDTGWTDFMLYEWQVK